MFCPWARSVADCAWTSTSREGQTVSREAARASAVDHGHSRAQIVKAWTPWAILSLLVFLWGLPQVKAWLNAVSIFNFPIDGLHNQIERMPPVVAKATPEAAVEIYAASALAIDPDDPAEQAYLAMLASRLKLDPGLRASIDQEVVNLRA